MDSISQFYIEDKDGQEEYYIEVRGFSGERQCVKVDKGIFFTFRYSKCKIENQGRSDRKHIDLDSFDDDTYAKRNTNIDEVFETVWDHIRIEELWHAANDLTDKQRRRFLLRHYYDLQFKDIAIFEGCTGQAVIESVRQAESILKNKLRFFFE